MSSQESRILWCLVEGDTIPHYVRDIPIGANVTQLKEMLTQSIERLNNKKSLQLTLWKVVSLIPGVCAPSDFLFQPNGTVPVDPDRSLARRLADLGNIAACSKELSSGEEVGELYPEPHSLKHLHIVVQCREILAPSGPSGEC